MSYKKKMTLKDFLNQKGKKEKIEKNIWQVTKKECKPIKIIMKELIVTNFNISLIVKGKRLTSLNKVFVIEILEMIILFCGIDSGLFSILYPSRHVYVSTWVKILFDLYIIEGPDYADILL